MGTGTAAGLDTRDTILNGAQERFHRFGARKTTMGEVAREAGCSRATLYAHFANKEKLYAGLLERDHAAFLREVEAGIADLPDARQKLRGVVAIALATYMRNPVLMSVAARDGEMTLEPVARDAIREHERRIIALLQRVLEEGVAEGSLRPIDPAKVAYLMFQLGSLLVARQTAGDAEYEFNEIIGAMDDLFNYGLAAAPPTT